MLIYCGNPYGLDINLQSKTIQVNVEMVRLYIWYWTLWTVHNAVQY